MLELTLKKANTMEVNTDVQVIFCAEPNSSLAAPTPDVVVTESSSELLWYDSFLDL